MSWLPSHSYDLSSCRHGFISPPSCEEGFAVQNCPPEACQIWPGTINRCATASQRHEMNGIDWHTKSQRHHPFKRKSVLPWHFHTTTRYDYVFECHPSSQYLLTWKLSSFSACRSVRIVKLTRVFSHPPNPTWWVDQSWWNLIISLFGCKSEVSVSAL